MKQRIKDTLTILLLIATILALVWFAHRCYRTYCIGEILQYQREIEVGLRMNPNIDYMNDVSKQ
jgi:uncharacterized membrane protein